MSDPTTITEDVIVRTLSELANALLALNPRKEGTKHEIFINSSSGIHLHLWIDDPKP